MTKQLDQQFLLLQQKLQHSHSKHHEGVKIHHINTQKWKIIMLQTLEELKTQYEGCDGLIDDILHVVKKITEDKFVEAIICMQPFKPNFQIRGLEHLRSPPSIRNKYKFQQKSLLLANHQTQLQCNSSENNKNCQKAGDMFDDAETNCSSMFKKSLIQQKMAKIKKKQIKEIIEIFTEEETLSREFSKPNHPYKKIIDTFTLIFENKYKQILEKINLKNNITIEELQTLMRTDLEILQKFMSRSSSPLLDVFKLQKKESKLEKLYLLRMLDVFMTHLVQNNQKINEIIHKVLRSYSRNVGILSKVEQSVPNYVQIQQFNIDQELQIEGAYVYTTNALLQFSSAQTPKDCLTKLSAVRQIMYKDIEQYYMIKSKQNLIAVSEMKTIKMTCDSQVQILRFILSKLKVFIHEIYSQLKFLETIYGEDDMCVKFQDASYIFSQLTVAIEALVLPE